MWQCVPVCGLTGMNNVAVCTCLWFDRYELWQCPPVCGLTGMNCGSVHLSVGLAGMNCGSVHLSVV